MNESYRCENERPELAKVIAHIRALTATPPEQDDELTAWARDAAMRYSRVDGIVPALPTDTRTLAIGQALFHGEWVCAPGADPDRRLLYLHGGGWMSGNPAAYRHVTAVLSELAGVSVLALDYRLAPEHPFPAALDDSFAAYRWLLDNSLDQSKPAEHVFIAGDSAGANLAVATWFRCRDHGIRPPDALLPISPAFDLTFSSPSMASRRALDPLLSYESLCGMAQVYVQDGTPLDHPEVSPLFGDLHGLPPTLIHVGDSEVLLDDALRFADNAKAAGEKVELEIWPEMIHVFQCFHMILPEARRSLEQLAQFLKRI